MASVCVCVCVWPCVYIHICVCLSDSTYGLSPASHLPHPSKAVSLFFRLAMPFDHFAHIIIIVSARRSLHLEWLNCVLVFAGARRRRRRIKQKKERKTTKTYQCCVSKELKSHNLIYADVGCWMCSVLWRTVFNDETNSSFAQRPAHWSHRLRPFVRSNKHRNADKENLLKGLLKIIEWEAIWRSAVNYLYWLDKLIKEQCF